MKWGHASNAVDYGGGGDRGWRRETWLAWSRAIHAMDGSQRLLMAIEDAATNAMLSASRRPREALRTLQRAAGQLARADHRLRQAYRAVAQMERCTYRQPDDPDTAWTVGRAAGQCIFTEEWLRRTKREIADLQRELQEGLESGELVPEPSGRRRPRIALAPRPVPIRAFLLLRQHRVADRICPLLRRRRRTPRPAGLRVPRTSVLGRAPPLFPVCAL